MFTVPIIAPDLRHEETIIQAAHALNALQQTIDKVFQGLDKRIASNSGKVKDLGMRIANADQRIRSLVGVKKAVRIFAPARYPATHVLCDAKVSFSQQDTERSESEKYEIKSRFESNHPDSRHEKLVFFHINSVQADSLPEQLTAARIKLNNLGHTLGAPTADLSSAVCLLRFNTEEEAYNRQMTYEQSGVRAESWRRAKLPKNQQQKPERKRLLEPAPHSLANRNQRAQPAGDLRYMPKMHEAPIIDLPMDLPSLDGVAQDIHFVGFVSTNAANKEVELPKQKQQHFETEVLETTTKIIPISKLPNITAVATTANTPPPPPPPPPPIPAVEKEKVIESKAVEVKSLPAAAAVPDNRSALMDAIRQAGGARGGRLRAAAAAPVDVTDNRKPAAASSGNLMEDLHNKLLMRRKGISGSNTTSSSSSSNPVLQRLSALIPPPPNKNVGMEQQHSDNEDPTSTADDGDWE